MTGKRTRHKLLSSLKKLSGFSVGAADARTSSANVESVTERLNASRAAAQRQREAAAASQSLSSDSTLSFLVLASRTFDEEESRRRVIADQRRLAGGGASARVPGPPPPRSWVDYEGTYGIAPGVAAAPAAFAPRDRANGVRVIINSEPVYLRTASSSAVPSLLEMCAYVVGTTLVRPVPSAELAAAARRTARRKKKRARRRSTSSLKDDEDGPTAMELDVVEDFSVAVPSACSGSVSYDELSAEARLAWDVRRIEGVLSFVEAMPWEVRRAVLRHASSAGVVDDTNIRAFALKAGENVRALDLSGCGVSNSGVFTAMGNRRRREGGDSEVARESDMGAPVPGESLRGTWEDLCSSDDWGMSEHAGGLCARPAVRILELNLSGCKLVEGGARFVGEIASSCPSLRMLSLSGCFGELTGPTTVASIAAALHTLEVIDLSGCAWVGDAEVGRLRHLPRLRKAIVRNCPLVTSLAQSLLAAGDSKAAVVIGS